MCHEYHEAKSPMTVVPNILILLAFTDLRLPILYFVLLLSITLLIGSYLVFIYYLFLCRSSWGFYNSIWHNSQTT